MRLVQTAVGLLLLAAAGLKLYGLNVSPFAQYGWLQSDIVQSTAVVWEVLLGLLLLSRAQRFFAWLLAVLTFGAFAGVSGYLGWIGQATCGCFGLIQASPWWAFAVNVSVLLALALVRPRVEMVRPTGTHSERTGWATVGILMSLIAVIGVVAIWQYGSVTAVVAAVRGEPLTIHPIVIDLGEGPRGRRLIGQVSVTNHSSRPVRLVGGTTDCACVTTEDLPVTVPAGGQVDIRVRVTVSAEYPGVATQRALIWTDAVEQPTLHVLMQYRVGPQGVVPEGQEPAPLGGKQ